MARYYKVKLSLSTDEESFKIVFNGVFCYSCGFYDYFDDFKILLEEKGLKNRIAEITEVDDGGVVDFRLSQA